MRYIDAAFPFITAQASTLTWHGDVDALLKTPMIDRKDLAKAFLAWKRKKGRTWPVIPLRGAVLFPGTTMSFDIGRESSLRALADALRHDRELFVTAQLDAAVEDPEEDEMYKVGCLAKIRQVMELRDDSDVAIQKVLLVGLRRAKIGEFKKSRKPYHEVTLEFLNSKPIDVNDLENKAAYRLMLKTYERLAQVSGRIPPERVMLVSQRTDWGKAADEIVSTTFFRLEPCQQTLETFDVRARLFKVIDILQEELQIMEYERALDLKVRGKIDKNQHEYYLREQLRAIQEELGDQDSQLSDEAQLLVKLEASLMPEEIKLKVKKEIERFGRIAPGSPEATVQRNWLETLVELPFGRVDKEKHNLSRARRILARDHYGMEKVKERIMEYLAVRKLATETNDDELKSPILCFVGPPGVGKTSIAKSIAEALGRRYIRMSLGGIRDEAEIRGHRRTYIGAMPGRIMQGIRQVDTDNPLFLLDEIDKLGADFRGDPSSALLEVLDPEQNTSFRDHYLEVPYDLSHVLFIMTANNYDTIPDPLLDRMEVIDVSGYTEEEKIEIARRHLLPKQIRRHALQKDQVKITRAALARLISWYTREAGVRQLERELAHVCRRAAIEIAEKGATGLHVRPTNLEDILGPRKFTFDLADKQDRVGIATGLAWTWSGGDTLTIEVNVMPGDGKLELTGQLGDVMKESARAALTYIRSRSASLGLTDEDTKKKDIHIHVPAGATPKDGPSAGITLATALASALTKRAVRHDIAMTGEITLRGRILPIGGLKEKAVAANRAGIETILIPRENMRDLVDIPESVKKRVKIVPVEHMDEVLDKALLPEENVEKSATKRKES